MLRAVEMLCSSSWIGSLHAVSAFLWSTCLLLVHAIFFAVQALKLSFPFGCFSTLCPPLPAMASAAASPLFAVIFGGATSKPEDWHDVRDAFGRRGVPSLVLAPASVLGEGSEWWADVVPTDAEWWAAQAACLMRCS